MNGRWWFSSSLVAVAAMAASVAPRLSAAPEAAVEAPPAPAPQVVGGAPVTATLAVDRPATDAASRRVGIRLDLHGSVDDARPTLPTDLVVVLDRSGSMSGDKIEDARAAAHALVGLLGAEDRLALVSFAGDATLDVPLSVRPSTGWSGVIDGLQAGGSTNMLDGLMLARTIAQTATGRNTRVVLVSDGAPDDEVGLRDLARDLAHREIPLTAVGVGDDWDEGLMSQLADAGTGNLRWVRRGEGLDTALAAEFAGSRSAVARSAEVTVRGPVRLIEAGGLPVEGSTVSLGAVLSGQQRTVWLTLEVEAGISGTVDLGQLDLHWTTPTGLPGSVTIDAPAVEVLADPRAAWSQLDGRWSDHVVQAEWSGLKAEVAELVRIGDLEAALGSIEGYQYQNRAMNEVVGDAAVTANLVDADELADQVRAQFVGEDQGERRNLWAKTQCVEARNELQGTK